MHGVSNEYQCESHKNKYYHHMVWTSATRFPEGLVTEDFIANSSVHYIFPVVVLQAQWTATSFEINFRALKQQI